MIDENFKIQSFQNVQINANPQKVTMCEEYFEIQSHQRVSGFFTMVEEKYEIQFFQMLQMLPILIKRTEERKEEIYLKIFSNPSGTKNDKPLTKKIC
jgi:hypothetical protein